MSSIKLFSRRSCLAAAGATALGAGPAASAATRPQVGQPAPPFTVYTYRSEKFTGDDLRGKVVVLNFWATWCGPCKIEMVVFDRWMRSHPGADLKIFSVLAMDGTALNELRPFAMKVAFSLATHLYGPYAPLQASLPTSYVIDRAGVLRHAAPGAFTAESFDATISPLLAPPVSTV